MWYQDPGTWKVSSLVFDLLTSTDIVYKLATHGGGFKPVSLDDRKVKSGAKETRPCRHSRVTMR